jgi:TRAP-type C4-dicarboxylate transport system permease small subunit
MRILFRLNGWLVRALCVAAVALIAAMMLGISAEVVLRMFGFPSIIGLIELTEYALFISTFFIAPHLLRTNEHIRVDIVMSRVDPDAAKWVECLVLVLIMLISLITGTVATIIMLRSARESTLVFKDLIFPQWWLDWIIPLASLALLLQALEMLVALLRTPHPPHHEQSEFIPGIQSEEMP